MPCRDDQCGAFLVWGDPSLYDSTLRIVAQLAARARVAFEYEVIPGITSIQVLAARHRIPLNGIGESVLITTGRNLSSGRSENIEKTVVMLDGQCSFRNLTDAETEIFWVPISAWTTKSSYPESSPRSQTRSKQPATARVSRTAGSWIPIF